MQAIITVIRRTTYTSIVEMDQADYDRLNEALDEGDRRERKAAEEELNNLIDTADWQDDELDRVDEFKPYAPSP